MSAVWHPVLWALPEDQQYIRWLKRTIAAICILGLILPFIQVPELTREQKEKISPQMARILIEKKPNIPKPPPPLPKPEKKKEPPKATPEPKTKPKPKPKAEAPKPELPKPKPAKPKPPAPTQQVQQARQKAAQSGLLKMKNELAVLKNRSSQPQLTTQPKPPVMASASKSAPSSAPPSTAVLHKQALSRTQQRVVATSTTSQQHTIDSHQTAQVSHDGPIHNEAIGLANSSSRSNTSESSKAGVRDEASIRRVFDENKSVIYGLYHRALRKQPGLQGKFVVELTIQPSGEVSECTLVSSELGDAALERKLLLRIKMLNFGAKPVDVRKLTYSLDFLPN